MGRDTSKRFVVIRADQACAGDGPTENHDPKV